MCIYVFTTDMCVLFKMSLKERFGVLCLYTLFVLYVMCVMCYVIYTLFILCILHAR